MAFRDLFSRKTLNEEERVVKDAVRIEDRETVDTDVSPVSLEEATIQEIYQFLDKLKIKAKDKRELYAIYDKMAQDSIISGALNILADDIVKKDFLREKRFWAEPVYLDGVSSEEVDEVVDKVNEFYKEMKFEDKVWGYAYRLLKYGEAYLNTYDHLFSSNEKLDPLLVGKKGRVYEIVDQAADVLTLEKYGEIVGYGEVARDSENQTAVGYNLRPTTEYIHFICDKKLIREPINLVYHDEVGQEKRDRFNSVIGSSYLEAARQAWTIIDLIETLLLYVRYNRSDVFNIVSVEVGTAGKNESTRILRSVKRIFTNQDSLDIANKAYTGYHKPVPHGENIYVATKQGKGEINVNQVGGNFDIKDIVDLDYWLNKLIAALGAPKAYLGLDDGSLTGLNNQSLTRQDIRYCRTVEAYKEPVIAGLKAVCDNYLESIGYNEYLECYQIVGTKIMSAETTDRMEDFNSKIELANAIKGFLSEIEGVNMNKVIKLIIEKILDLEEIDLGLKDLIPDNPTSSEDEGEEK